MTSRIAVSRSEMRTTPLPGEPIPSTRMSARRISVVGASGSGKSYLARVLAERLRLPLVDLDALKWELSGRELPRDLFVQRVAAAVDDQDWVIDGHYRDVRHLIWRRAEMVVWLNYPLPVVVWRLVTRFGRKLFKLQEPGRNGPRADPSLSLPAQGRTVTWRRRMSRFARNLREQREYRELLHGSAYQPLTIVEMRSAKATAEWVEHLAPLD